MRASEGKIAFKDEERRGWLELLMNHKNRKGVLDKKGGKKPLNPVLTRAGSVQDVRNAKLRSRNENVLLNAHRKWKDDSVISVYPEERHTGPFGPVEAENDTDSNLYFHLFLLEYFWQLSAFDHGRFRTILFHLMTTGIFDMSYDHFQALLLDKNAASAAARTMPPGLHSLLRNILKEYKTNGAERLTYLLGHDPTAAKRTVATAVAARTVRASPRFARSSAKAAATAAAIAVSTPSAFGQTDDHNHQHAKPPQLHARSRFALGASSRAALPRLPRNFSSPCLPTQILCPNPSSSALPPLALPFASPFLPFTTSRYVEEFVEDSTLGNGGFGTVFKAHRILDGRVYAIKKIHFRVSQRSTRKLEKVVREVQALASLDHVNVCRYYNAWIEPIQQRDLEDMLRKAEQNSYETSEESTLSAEMRNPLDATELLSTSESVSSPLVQKDQRKGRISPLVEWKESAFGEDDQSESENEGKREGGSGADYFGRSSTNEEDDDDIFERPAHHKTEEDEEFDAAELEEASIEADEDEDEGEDGRKKEEDETDDGDTVGFFQEEDFFNVDHEFGGGSGSSSSSQESGRDTTTIVTSPKKTKTKTKTKKTTARSRKRSQSRKRNAERAKAKKKAGAIGRGLRAGALIPSAASDGPASLSRSPEGQLVPWRPSAKTDESEDDSDEDGDARLVPGGSAPLTHTLYIQMQCYDDNTLQHWLAREGRAVVREENLHIFKQIVEALHHVHSKHIIHRDLKPANVFLCDGVVKLGDFGLAKRKVFVGGEDEGHHDGDADEKKVRIIHNKNQVEEHTAGCGTLSYSAPEQRMAGGKYSEKVDIYALGIILLELYQPFGTAMERMFVLSDLREKSILPAHIPLMFPEEAAVIMRMLASRPELRPSAAELLAIPLLSQHKHEESVYRLSEELEAKNRLIEKQRNELDERESRIRELEQKLARMATSSS